MENIPVEIHSKVGTKLERARDFSRNVENSSAKICKRAILNMQISVKHGLARRAMSVYERATEYVVEEEQYDVYCRYIKQAEEIFGAPYTRAIYQKAIEICPTSTFLISAGLQME